MVYLVSLPSHKNLSEYVTTFLARMRAQVHKASQSHVSEEENIPQELPPPAEQNTFSQEKSKSKKTVLEQAAEARRAQRLDQYHQVLALYEQGLHSPEIAPRVGVSARTVRQWLVDGINTKPRRRRPSPLDASYLYHRWKEGEQNGERLYEELQAKGYTGSHRALYRYLKRWKSPRASPPVPSSPPLPKLPPGKTKKALPPPGPFDECQAKQAVWLYMRSPEKLKPEEQKQLTFLRQVHPTLELACSLVQAFVEMMHKREGEKLEAWLEQIRQCQIPELIRFANGMKRDKAPVQAALTLQYSNGVVEGHVHRLKLIKRQGYGRAAFPLLRKRVLHCI